MNPVKTNLVKLNNEQSRLLKLAAAIVLFAGLASLAPPADLQRQGFQVIVVLIVLLFLWVTQALPYSVSSVIGIITLFLWGVGPLEQIATGFMSTAAFFMVSVMLIGQIIQKTGLARKLALLFLSLAGNSLRRVVLLTPPLLLFVTLFFPSAVARTTTIKPIYDDIIRERRLPPFHHFSRATMLSLGVLNQLASCAYMTGSMGIVVTVEILATCGISLNWFQWLLAMWLPTAVILLLATFYLYFRYPFSVPAAAAAPPASATFTREDRVLMAIIVSMVTGWIVSSFFGLPSFIIAVSGAVALFLPGINLAGSNSLKLLNWDIVLLNCATISIARLLLETGAAHWIGLRMVALLAHAHGRLGIILLFIVLIVIARVFFLGDLHFVISIVPVALTLDRILDAPPHVIAFVVLLAGTVNFFPVQAISALLARENDCFHRSDMAMLALFMLIAVLLVLPLAIYYYWPLLARIIA